MTTSPDTFVDAEARARIADSGLRETLFVEAGAGTGKTFELVQRVTNLVLREGVPLRNLAAITFTEAAGAELRDRIRQRFEEIIEDDPDGPDRAAAQLALAETDIAAIGTLHSFALRILGEHPLEVGLPPRVEVLDEVSSQLAFEERWVAFVDDLYEEPAAEELLLTARMLDLPIESATNRASLKDVAAVFSDNWDRLDPDEALLGSLPPVDWSPLRRALAEVEALLPDCTNPTDRLYERITTVIAPQVRHLLEEPDRYRQLESLTGRIGTWRRGRGGSGKCWTEVAAVKEAIDAVDDAADAVRLAQIDAVLQRLRIRLAHFTRAEAERRRREGRLEFHDLLVLARELVRDSAAARSALHDRYQRLLLDEFQDTDPIQIEVAARIAGVVSGRPPEAWADVPVDDGRLFFVGDPKQSIYRFRRADIEMFMRARDVFAGGGTVALTQNFRTVEPVLTWVNHVFTQVMPEEIEGAQPRYQPLHPARTELGGDHRVVLLGGERADVRAAALRAEEATAVARAIATIRDEPEAWPVQDETVPRADQPAWRAPRLSDITILVPTRTSLRQLEDALDGEAIPYRVDTGTLVYDTQEVRDVLAALRAIDDPNDEIALVAALRAPLYACSDADLFTFRHAGGRWRLRSTPPTALPADHPVLAGMAHLRLLSDERWWLEPSALLQRLLDERQAFAIGLAHRRPREVWRRLRFLLDQAHQFEESGGRGLRAFLRWTDLQSLESSRVHEPLLPETDDVAVSIKTVHGAKGLEFPITVVSGLTTKKGGKRTGVSVVWEGDQPGIRFRKGTATANFDRQAEFEAEMDVHERQRLLYVACTRARDHLIVSTFHEPGVDCHGATLARHSEAVEDPLCRRLPAPLDAEVPDDRAQDDLPRDVPVALATERHDEGAADHVGRAAPLPDLVDGTRGRWRVRRNALLASQRSARFLSATGVARLDRAAATPPPVDADLDPEQDDLADEVLDDDATVADESGRPAFSRRRGRAGTAIGRAVHACLQLVDLATGDGLAELAAQQAFAEAVPDRADTVATLARSALESTSVRAALAGGRLWREAYVAAPLGDRAVEGYVDLLYEGPDGLVIVDYKTDAVADEAAVDAKLDQYRLQLATYAEALAMSTGLDVAAARLVFCRAAGAIERDVPDLAAARTEVRALLGAARSPT